MNSEEPRILLVDDDELNRRMMGLLLSEKGYNYDTASNGIEAVAAVKSQSYDIVLMDLQMPIMNGFDAARNIREWEAENRHVPIVALTAMLFDDEMQKCLNAGMDDCIAKPFNTEVLFQLIESYVINTKRPTLLNELHETGQSDVLPVLDVQDALPRFGKDIQIYRDFLNEFMDDLPERIHQFRRALLSGDFETLAAGAHNLKGISGSMGAKQLSYLLQKLDQECQNGESLLIQQTFEEIEEHAFVLQNEVKKILSETTLQLENHK